MYVYGRRIFLHLESFGFRLIMRSRKVPLLVKRGRGGWDGCEEMQIQD